MVIVPFQSALNSLLGKRIIRLGGEVNDDIANSIVAQLLYLDAKDPEEDVTLYINSPGGSVTAGMAMFDTMRHIRPDIKTVCVGMAASMGAFLLSSGTKGKRYGLPNCRIMVTNYIIHSAFFQRHVPYSTSVVCLIPYAITPVTGLGGFGA
eukprot:1181748-Prorocentrum_minimum.AAC.5